MLRLPHPLHLLLPISLLAAFALTGCTGPSFPYVSPTSSQVPVGPIQGNDWGGHAPLVDARIFLLQAGTGGYGAKATSLLSSTYSGTTYPTALDSITGSPTNGMYYVQTSATGNFSLNGDYTCTAGDPVYIYASSGNPTTTPVVNITGASESDDANSKLLVTFATTGNQLLYQGESVTFSAGIPSPYNTFSGTTQTVSSLNLTTTTFAVELGAWSSNSANGTFSATVTQASSASNPAIVNLALLGVCPSTGAQNFSSLNFVYLNEVSTVADGALHRGQFEPERRGPHWYVLH
jgi:hypothetical protein